MHHKPRRNPPPPDTADDPWEPRGLTTEQTIGILPIVRETCLLHRTRCPLCRRDIPGGTRYWRSLRPNPSPPHLCDMCGISLALSFGLTTEADIVEAFQGQHLAFAPTPYNPHQPPLFPH